MSAQSGDQQRLSKGLMITLGAVAALGAALALWAFVIQPLTADSGSDPVVDAGGQASPEPGATTAPGAATPGPGAATPGPGAATPGPGAATPSPGAATPSPGASPAPGQDGDATQGGEPGQDGAAGSSSDDEDQLGDTVDIVNARDPFQQLVVGSSGGGGSSAGDRTAGSTGSARSAEPVDSRDIDRAARVGQGNGKSQGAGNAGSSSDSSADLTLPGDGVSSGVPSRGERMDDQALKPIAPSQLDSMTGRRVRLETDGGRIYEGRLGVLDGSNRVEVRVRMHGGYIGYGLDVSDVRRAAIPR